MNFATRYSCFKRKSGPQNSLPVILDFGGVLYDIDYDAPPKAFAALGDPDFASLYHQAAQSTWFDDLETGRLDRETFYGHLAERCHLGTTSDQIHEAWCCILTGMPSARADLVTALGTRTRLFLLSNTNAIHAAVFEADLQATLPDVSARCPRRGSPPWVPAVGLSDVFLPGVPAGGVCKGFSARAGV